MTDTTIATIGDLDLPVRAYNILTREGVQTIPALTSMTEEALMELRSFGTKELLAVQEALARYGLRLKPITPQPFNDVIDVEHVTVYRWGGLQVTVNGDGSGVISQRELDPFAMQALVQICAQIGDAMKGDDDEQN